MHKGTSLQGPRRMAGLLGLAASILLYSFPQTAAADVLVLKDGTKLPGRVTEKAESFEIIVEQQVLVFDKADVDRLIKSAEEFLGDASRSFEEAKKIYTEAIKMKDPEASNHMRTAIPHLNQARDTYAEASDFFPENESIQKQLIAVMQLYRMIRGSIGSELAGKSSVVQAKESVQKPRSEAPAARPAPPPPPAAKAPAPPPTPAPAPPSPPPTEEVSVSPRLTDALGILLDPAKRTEPEAREKARTAFRQEGAGTALRDTAMAGYMFLSSPDFPADSEAAQSIQAFFESTGLAKLQWPTEEGLTEALSFLSLKVKELRNRKDRNADRLALFVAGPASDLIERRKGNATSEIQAMFKDLGYRKSEFDSVWGVTNSLAMDDFHKWLDMNEYNLAVVQFEKDYGDLTSFPVQYAAGLLYLFKAVADNREYALAASWVDRAARNAASPKARDHALALAKSIRTAAPCRACGGTRELKCSVCKGKTTANLQCKTCEGSGQVMTTRGVVRCRGCEGKGRFLNVKCPKCKATGKTPCKARGCEGPTPPKTTLESFAEVYYCALCEGHGSVMRHVATTCPDCDGIGIILKPKTAPAKMLW